MQSERKNMLYSRHQIDKAGRALIGENPFERSAAVPIIQKWRETHIPVIESLDKQLKEYFDGKGIKYSISSNRIKRMVSIEAKLRNNSDRRMNLGGMQDVGGIRYVFKTIEDVEKVKIALQSFCTDRFTLVRVRDYIRKPKHSGYRGAHFVFKYDCEDKKYDGLSIEVQIRTELQHSWAMAVETASLISKTSLKADIDDKSEWRDFFRLTSALFAREEEMPVCDQYKDYSEEQFCKDYFCYKKYRLIDQLKALRVTVNADFKSAFEGYCVLTIDFVKRLVYAKTFNVGQENEASEWFRTLEVSINSDEAALMVGLDNIKDIREAYPSYFLDTKMFIELLDDFENRCGLLLDRQ